MLEFQLKKAYPEFTLSLSAHVENEWLVLLAPSGAGKSLTLDLISGIVQPDAGHVRLDGRTLFDSEHHTRLPIRKRRIGYLLQDYALFPHLSVAENIAYGLPRGVDARAAVAEWMRFFRLTGRERARPGELSGGQRQRVALARTMASEPQLLLLDEPFSALDRVTREELHGEMDRLKADLSLPVILVTHDFVEAQLLGDRVAVLEDGAILETGEKSRIFAHPQKHRTARFLGVDNVAAARVMSVDDEGMMHIRWAGHELKVIPDARFKEGQEVYLCIHAADVRMLLSADGRVNSLPARITHVFPEGGTNRVRVEVDNGDASHKDVSSGNRSNEDVSNGTVSNGPVSSGAVSNPGRLEMLMDDYVIGRYGVKVGDAIPVFLPPNKLFLCE